MIWLVGIAMWIIAGFIAALVAIRRLEAREQALADAYDELWDEYAAVLRGEK